MNYINNLGEFSSIANVWKEYPHGGKEGDYVVVNGKKIAWNKYTSNWGEDPKMPGVNDEVDSDFLVKGDLRVGGKIINKDLQRIKESTVLNKGYFKTVDGLKKSYPTATSGSKAYVGSNYPYAIYLWDVVTSAWVDSGETGGDEDVDLSDYYTKSETETILGNIQPIVINGDVTNAPDEEDITSEDGLLKLADRTALNGKGYVILRKGKSFAEQVTSENTIYEVRYNIDLNKEEVTIPDGCVLDFRGGSIANGTIYFNRANIRADSVKIFENIEFGSNPEGSLNVCWFGANYKTATDSTDAFNAACSKKMPVYIPNGIFYIGGTIKVYASIKCDGRIRCWGSSSQENKIVFFVEGTGHATETLDTIVLDGLHITEVGEKWTRTAIEVQRTDTVVQNCYVLACDFGIRLRIYCTYITNSCVRTCNTNIDVSALSNYQQTCNVAIIGCVSQHANDLALSIGVHRPDLEGAGDYHSGFGILVSGCAFDEGTVQIEKSHTVGIRDCYFERATARNIGILINQDSQNYSRSRSRNIVIESCTFIEFKYAIKVWLGCENLAIRNCNFKACRRYAIAMRYESANYPVTIESNVYETDVVRDVFYSYRNWGGIYKEMALNNISYDKWYMRRGVQVMPHTIKGIPINYNALITKNDNRSLLATPKNDYGNVYAEPLVVEAAATYNSGKLTFANDADYVKLSLNDRLLIKGKIVIIIDLELDENVATIMNVGGVVMSDGEEVIVSHVAVELNYFQRLDSRSSRPSDIPTGYCMFDTSLSKPIWKSDSGWVDATGETV